MNDLQHMRLKDCECRKKPHYGRDGLPLACHMQAYQQRPSALQPSTGREMEECHDMLKVMAIDWRDTSFLFKGFNAMCEVMSDHRTAESVYFETAMPDSAPRVTSSTDRSNTGKDR